MRNPSESEKWSLRLVLFRVVAQYTVSKKICDAVGGPDTPGRMSHSSRREFSEGGLFTILSRTRWLDNHCCRQNREHHSEWPCGCYIVLLPDTYKCLVTVRKNWFVSFCQVDRCTSHGKHISGPHHSRLLPSFKQYSPELTCWRYIL